MVVCDINLCKSADSLYFAVVTSKQDVKQLNLSTYDGILINTSGNEQETRVIVDSLKKTSLLLAVMSYDHMYNRRVLETMNIHYFVDIHNAANKDTLKQSDSGLNNVLAKIAAKKKVTFLINMQEFMRASQTSKIAICSRIMQNITLCRKNNCTLSFVSMAKSPSKTYSVKQRESLLYSLGASSQQVKQSTHFS